jgi:hypothetical protein
MPAKSIKQGTTVWYTAKTKAAQRNWRGVVESIEKIGHHRTATVKWDNGNSTQEYFRALSVAAPANAGVMPDAPRDERPQRHGAENPANFYAEVEVDDPLDEDDLVEVHPEPQQEEKEPDEPANDQKDYIEVKGRRWRSVAGGGEAGEADIFAQKTRFFWDPHLQQPQARRTLDYFNLAFPLDHIQVIVRATNAQLVANGKAEVDEAELFKFLGITYATTFYQRTPLRSLWRRPDQGKFQVHSFPDFGKRLGMVRTRFEDIRANLRVALYDPESVEYENDKYIAIRPFVDAFNKRRTRMMSPGKYIVIDECMSAWRGNEYAQDAMPNVSKIARKPKGVGCEFKSLGDCETGVMLKLEIQEHKTKMATKKFRDTMKAHTAIVCRLSEEYFNTNRVVLGDSAFASVATALEMKKNGLYFMGPVKTCHSEYPKKHLKRRFAVMERGQTEFLVNEDAETKFKTLALVWKDNTDKLLISSWNNTQVGRHHEKKRYIRNEEGQVEIRQFNVPRSVVADEYFNNFHQIDVHDHYRQHGLGLEMVWRTTKWQQRLMATLLGMIEVDAYLMYKASGGQEVQQDFLNDLIYELCFQNQFSDRAVRNVPQDEQKQQMHVKGNIRDHVKYKNTPKQGYRNCKSCKARCSTFCEQCSTDTTVVALCVKNGCIFKSCNN